MFAYIARLIKRVIYAFGGIWYAIRHDDAFQIQFFVGGVFFGAVWFLFYPLTQGEAAMLLLAWTLVLITELQNTASETALDRLHPEMHDAIGKAKDMYAGAVVIAALFALGVVLTIAFNHLS